MSNTAHTQFIKKTALELGFMNVAIAKAEFMEPEAKMLEVWLNNGHQGSMDYMNNHFDLRVDPTKLVPGAKSVISLMYNYYTDEQQVAEAPKISMYALGKDYHKVVRKKLKHLFERMKDKIGHIEGRYFVDSAPILERDWAKRSGLGWTGKNTLTINPKLGSYFFLAEIICDLPLDYDLPIKDHCGTCTRCIDACPTEAISPQGYLLDSNKCISYLTIERKDDIPSQFKNKMEGYMYGCDICQQVCPWNRFSTHHKETAFHPNQDLLTMSKSEWMDLSEDTFNTLFEGCAVKRTKFKGLKRNINFLYKS
ncbi:MAG TPA: tRNA epoxyqueuosine(34) reductase QueG [Saprospiraceae bacterium]|nr:tRNA epoxyqueuosine(34) reductase QueG [Saprospiraceae bacterium]